MAPRERTRSKPITREEHIFHINNVEHTKKTLDNAVLKEKITSDDAFLIESYISERKATKHLSPGRVNKILYTLISWRQFIGPFRQNNILDIYRGIDSIKTGNYTFTLNSREVTGKYMQNTMSDHVRILKPFYLWLIEEEISSIPEKKLKAISPPAQDTMTKEASDMLSKEEVTAIIDSCTWSRDRALIHVLYEGGFRIGELGKLTWRDIKFDQTGVAVNVNAKTMKPRYIRLVLSRHSLAQWKADHPYPDDPTAPVFLTRDGKPVTYSGLAKQIQRLVKRAGIERRVTPHIFRHSRITHLIQDGLSESVIKLMMWGDVSTDMFKTYMHLTGSDIDRAVNEMHGIKDPEVDHEPKGLKPQQCMACYYINGPTQLFCGQCGAELNPKAVTEKVSLVGVLHKFVSKMSAEELAEVRDEIKRYEELKKLENMKK